MKKLDIILQNWRYRIAEPWVTKGSIILDIGGLNGSFLKRVSGKIAKGICIDPLIKEQKEERFEFIKYKIIDGIPFPENYFDIITMLAVYEHLGSNREIVASEIFRVLKPHGRVILTVPSKIVDYILKILLKTKLADGMSLEEHKIFNASDVIKIFKKCGMKLKHWSKFQFGLNNLFIFEKMMQ